MKATGSTNEPEARPCPADPPVRGPRGGVRDLVPGPVWAGRRERKPGGGGCRFCRVSGAGDVRLVVPAQDEDAAMKAFEPVGQAFRPAIDPSSRTRRLLHASRAVTTAAAIVIGGSTSVFACPVCFGAEET